MFDCRQGFKPRRQQARLAGIFDKDIGGIGRSVLVTQKIEQRLHRFRRSVLQIQRIEVKPGVWCRRQRQQRQNTRGHDNVTGMLDTPGQTGSTRWWSGFAADTRAGRGDRQTRR